MRDAKKWEFLNSVIILAPFINLVLLYFIHKISRKPAEEGGREGRGDDGWEEGK